MYVSSDNSKVIYYRLKFRTVTVAYTKDSN